MQGHPALEQPFVDQAKRSAETHATPYTVLISRCLPRGKKSLAVVDGVIVVDPGHAVVLAGILRRLVIDTHRASLVAGSQAEKTHELFRFISSTEFRQTFDSLTAATATLSGSLAKERQTHTKTWTERERLYNTISDTLIGIDERFRLILEENKQATPAHGVGVHNRNADGPRRPRDRIAS